MRKTRKDYISKQEESLKELLKENYQDYLDNPIIFTHKLWIKFKEDLKLEKFLFQDKEIFKKIEIADKLFEAIAKKEGMVLMEDKKYSKHRLLELLEKYPNVEEVESNEYNAWEDEVKTQLNELLRFFEEDNQISDLPEEIDEVRKALKRHRHLPTGEAVEEL